MERMEQIDRELEEIGRELEDGARLEARMRDLEERRRERQAKVEKTAGRLQLEQRDVDRLEKGGLRALLLSLTGDKEERLSKERREAAAARLQHDQAVEDLAWLDREVQALLEKKTRQRRLEGRLQALLEEKAELLKAQGGEAGEKLLELDRELAALEGERREVEEAQRAGREAETALAIVLDDLDTAGSYGTWDLLGGGLLADLGKHDRLSAARGGLSHAQRCLSRFRTELADVGPSDVPQVQVGEGATLADFLFDGIFADWYVQSGIRKTSDEVSAVHVQVLGALRRLEERKAGLDRRITALRTEREALTRKS